MLHIVMALNIDEFLLNASRICLGLRKCQRGAKGAGWAKDRGRPVCNSGGQGDLCRGSRQCGKAHLQQGAAVRHPRCLDGAAVAARDFPHDGEPQP